MIHFQHDIGHFVGALSRIPPAEREATAAEVFRRLEASQTFYDLALAERRLKGEMAVPSSHLEFGPPNIYSILHVMGLNPNNVHIEGALYQIVALFIKHAELIK